MFCPVDFCKAFDSIWREGMYFKLREIGITGNIFNVIKQYVF